MGGATTPANAVVTMLAPTTELGGQRTGLVEKVARSHWGAACGLTLSPTGRSTRTSLRTPTGSSSGPAVVCLTMNWVKPIGGWPAAWV